MFSRNYSSIASSDKLFKNSLSFCPQIIAPQFKHFQKLRDFVEMKLPPGFPVKLDIPVLPTVSARITFQVGFFKFSFLEWEVIMFLVFPL